MQVIESNLWVDIYFYHICNYISGDVNYYYTSYIWLILSRIIICNCLNFTSLITREHHLLRLCPVQVVALNQFLQPRKQTTLRILNFVQPEIAHWTG